jgi:hypothetical protein
MIVFFGERSVTAPGRDHLFLMPNRFNDGDPSNNRGRMASIDPEVTGFDPANPSLFHGGDLAGASAKLDYLRDLGATSIWMSPIFGNLAVQTRFLTRRISNLKRSLATYSVPKRAGTLNGSAVNGLKRRNEFSSTVN